MRSLSVARELDLLAGRQLQDLLDALANGVQDFLALLRGAALATSNITVTTAGNALANSACPDTNTVKGLANVDNDTHNLTIFLVLEGVANGGKHYVQPQLINVDVTLLLELVGPLATVLVLRVLPLGSHAGLEQVVVGLEGQLGNWCNVVLYK